MLWDEEKGTNFKGKCSRGGWVGLALIHWPAKTADGKSLVARSQERRLFSQVN